MGVMPRSPKGRAAARGLDARLRLQHAYMPAGDASLKTAQLIKMLVDSNHGIYREPDRTSGRPANVCFSNRSFEVKRFRDDPPPQFRCRSRAHASLRNRRQGPCMELSLSRSLLGSKSFVLRQFCVRSQRPFLSPDPHFALVAARSRLAVAPALRHASPLP